MPIGAGAAMGAALLLALPAGAQPGPQQDPHHPAAGAATAQAASPGPAPGGGPAGSPGAPGAAPRGAGPMGGPGMMMGPGMGMGGPGSMPGMGMTMMGDEGRGPGMTMRRHGFGGAPMNVIINVGPGIRVEVEDDGGRAGRMMGMPRGGAMGPGMMMGPGAMRPFERVEGRLAYYRAELGITEAQMPQWNAFAEALRAAAGRLRQAHAEAMRAAADRPGTVPEQLARRIALLSSLLETTRSVAEAARPLYEALSEEQKRTADALMAEHLRMMRMRGPWAAPARW
ncbi:hypothetical protein GCM10010964_17420 [Caldovatus sediminis]|uniref:LTXXQ motif family protein n=2 Tax=Caldovatus sediminis TaxID=2041189 RepID=A0A8J3EBY2_9PROT|nr:hypothetical protein GCM10010964_17420 [Caldovatus sediminis]